MKGFWGSMAIASALATVACQPINGSSLLSDKKELPSGYSVDSTPKVEELYMKVNKSQLYATGLTKIEITGECYTSTYATHYIRANLDATILTSMVDLLNPGVAAGTARCTNGVFSVSIATAQLSSGVNNSVRLMIYADGGTVTNDVQGATRVNISY